MSYNEQFISILDQIAAIMTKRGDQFRAKAYLKAMETIITIKTNIVSLDDVRGKPGIGTTILEKLDEFIKTGKVELIEAEKLNPVNILSEIYGIGPKKAQDLVESGIKSIEMLEQVKDKVLNDTQLIGLKYHKEIIQRIPRQEIQTYERVFDLVYKKVAEGIPDAKFQIVGSYRRGAENSGDIDVILTSKNPQIYVNFVNILIAKKIIEVVLSRGDSKCLVITRLSDKHIARRVDFLYTEPNQYPFALLYFTGSKTFNTVMRQHGLRLGYTFNEHCICHVVNGKKGPQVTNKVFNEEKDIFDFLGLQYVEPTKRLNGTLPSINPIVEGLRKHGIKYLESVSEETLNKFIQHANEMYFNKQRIMTDNEYDIVKEFISQTYPKNIVVKEVGAPVDRNKVQLPYEMWSMDKIKPDSDALFTWCKKYKGPYVLSCKMDGVSALYINNKLYTRGNGTVGQDISHLIKYIGLPMIPDGTAVRGELIMTKDIFDKKYKTQFANPRNLVAGIVNHKTVDVEKVGDIHFICYEVINPQFIPSKQFDLLVQLGFKIPHIIQTPSLTNELLSKILVDWRTNYEYEIDGIIVCNDNVYARKTGGNPEHAFAFKMVLTDQIMEAKVVDVLWTPSKDGYLKPRVQIEPLNLGGVKIEFATGFNGAFIRDNKIGVGALIEIIRSGDVIPHIRQVVVSATTEKMPDVPYKWTETGVDIMLVDMESDDTVKEKNITGFFKGIGVEGLSSGNINRLMASGFDSVAKILSMNETDFLKVDGFKEKMAAKLYTGIQDKINTCSLVQIMDASNIFGRGFSEKRIELIITEVPNILTSELSVSEKVHLVSSIKGMAQKTSLAFVEKIPVFIRFLKEAKLEGKLTNLNSNANASANTSTHKLSGKIIVITGSRDKEILDFLKSINCSLGTTVTKNTTLLIAKTKNDDTGKASDAKKLGIPILTNEEFKETYF
jgi:DNA ligase (NAD+)